MPQEQVLREQIVEVIRPYFRVKVDLNAIVDTTRIDELGIDSARVVDIVLDLENRFNIQILDEALDNFDTIGNITSLVQSQVS